MLTHDALVSADEHHPKEAERLLDSAALPIRAFPIRHSVLDWPFCGSVPHKTECLCLQLLPHRLGI